MGKDDSQILVGVGYSLRTNVSKVYLITGGDDSERVLITMRLERGRR